MKTLNLNPMYPQFLGRTMYSTLSRCHTHYPLCELNRDATRKLLSPFIYSDKNTSEIIPNQLNKRSIQKLIDYFKQDTINIQNLPKPDEL